jgi:protein-tyrosine kinase
MNTFAIRRKFDATPAASSVIVPLGQLLLDHCKLTEQDIVRVVAAQRNNRLRFGETAVELGLVRECDIREALARQYRYPCLPTESPERSLGLFAATDPFGPRSEALRTLRSQLSLRGFGTSRKSLVVTACRSGDGTSSLAANLALTYAQLGKKTLLIDANLRNPTQQHLLDLQAAAGLSQLLAGRCAIEDAVLAVLPFENLSVLCAGAVPPNPQELLSRHNFSQLLVTMSVCFDMVIVDTPAMLEFADAQVAASLTGACILSMQRHRTRIADIEELKRRIDPSGAELIGAVIRERPPH